MKNSKLIQRGLVNSLGVLIYVFLVSLILNNGAKIFGEVDNELFAPVVFLMLFVFSALTTGSLILGKPILLYLEGAKKEAIKLLFYTGASLFIIIIIISLALFLFK